MTTFTENTKFKFEIEDTPTNVQVTPIFEDAMIKIVEPENELFRYLNIEGSVKFLGDDFDYLFARIDEISVKMKIQEKDASGSYVDYGYAKLRLKSSEVNEVDRIMKADILETINIFNDILKFNEKEIEATVPPSYLEDIKIPPSFEFRARLKLNINEATSSYFYQYSVLDLTGQTSSGSHDPAYNSLVTHCLFKYPDGITEFDNASFVSDSGSGEEYGLDSPGSGVGRTGYEGFDYGMAVRLPVKPIVTHGTPSEVIGTPPKIEVLELGTSGTYQTQVITTIPAQITDFYSNCKAPESDSPGANYINIYSAAINLYATEDPDLSTGIYYFHLWVDKTILFTGGTYDYAKWWNWGSTASNNALEYYKVQGAKLKYLFSSTAYSDAISDKFDTVKQSDFSFFGIDDTSYPTWFNDKYFISGRDLEDRMNTLEAPGDYPFLSMGDYLEWLAQFDVKWYPYYDSSLGGYVIKLIDVSSGYRRVDNGFDFTNFKGKNWSDNINTYGYEGDYFSSIKRSDDGESKNFIGVNVELPNRTRGGVNKELQLTTNQILTNISEAYPNFSSDKLYVVATEDLGTSGQWPYDLVVQVNAGVFGGILNDGTFTETLDEPYILAPIINGLMARPILDQTFQDQFGDTEVIINENDSVSLDSIYPWERSFYIEVPLYTYITQIDQFTGVNTDLGYCSIKSIERNLNGGYAKVNLYLKDTNIVWDLTVDVNIPIGGGSPAIGYTVTVGGIEKTTNSLGQVLYEDLPEGVYKIYVDGKTYDDAEEEINLNANKTQNIDLTV